MAVYVSLPSSHRGLLHESRAAGPIDPSEEGELPKQRRRWPEEIRDDVLALLLILNEQRAAEEAPKKKTIKRKSKPMATPLFDSGDNE